MSRTTINFLLDTALLVIFVALMWCAVVVRFVFPPGPLAKNWQLWGGDYTQWTSIQFGLICLLALGILVHVMLHWSWVCGVIASFRQSDKRKLDDGIKTLYGVGLLIVILNIVGAGVAAATLSITGPR